MSSDFRTYYKAARQCGPGIKKNIQINKQSLETSPCIYSQLIFSKGNLVGERTGFSTNGAGTTKY